MTAVMTCDDFLLHGDLLFLTAMGNDAFHCRLGLVVVIVQGESNQRALVTAALTMNDPNMYL
jgi:hypothetical protein